MLCLFLEDAIVAQSIDTVFSIWSSSSVSVLGETSTFLSEPSLWCISLLYDSVASSSASEVVRVGLSMYAYCPAVKDSGALQRFPSWSTLPRLLRRFHWPIRPCLIVNRPCSRFAPTDYGVVIILASVENTVGFSNVVGPWGCCDTTKLKGDIFVEQCTWVLYAFVEGCT